MKSNTNKLSNLSDELDYFKNKVVEIQLQIDLINSDLIKPVECCGRKFDSKKLLSKHRETKACKSSRGAKHFSCPRCNRKFFDGYSSLEELSKHPLELLKSTYKKHVDEGCVSACAICGKAFNTQYMFKSHKCEVIEVIDKKDREWDTKPRTWDTWRHEGKLYDHNLESDEIFRHGKYIGYIKDKLFVFDSDAESTDGSSYESDREITDDNDECVSTSVKLKSMVII